MSLKLNTIVPWGRNIQEYQAMFDFTKSPKKIVSVGDGPASFNAEMAKSGIQVTSVDPLYLLEPEQIQAEIESAKEQILQGINPSGFHWERFQNPEHLAEVRLQTMQIFLEDFRQGKTEGRYVGQSAESLPFKNQVYDLALSSHFLLLYTAQFSYRQHLTTILEMLRVAKEVQIFPILDLSGEVSKHIAPLTRELEGRDYSIWIEKTAYHFQKGAFQRLRIQNHSLL